MTFTAAQFNNLVTNKKLKILPKLKKRKKKKVAKKKKKK